MRIKDWIYLNRKEGEDRRIDYPYIIITGILIVLNIYCFYQSLFRGLPDSERGTYGDMFGGLNTLFSGFAFIGLLITIVMQIQESKRSSNENLKNLKLIQNQIALSSQSNSINTLTNYINSAGNNSVYVEECRTILDNIILEKLYGEYRPYLLPELHAVKFENDDHYTLSNPGVDCIVNLNKNGKNVKFFSKENGEMHFIPKQSIVLVKGQDIFFKILYKTKQIKLPISVSYFEGDFMLIFDAKEIGGASNMLVGNLYFRPSYDSKKIIKVRSRQGVMELLNRDSLSLGEAFENNSKIF